MTIFKALVNVRKPNPEIHTEFDRVLKSSLVRGARRLFFNNLGPVLTSFKVCNLFLSDWSTIKIRL